MDAISDPSVHTVVMMSSSQVGKTEALLNCIGYYIDQDPAPMLLMQPTLEMAEAFSKDRLAPMLRDTPCLQSKVADARARDSGNTLLHKTFAGGHWTGVGANSPASLAMRPVRITLCDEVDRYPASAGAEGDPVNLARKRSATFWNRKLVLTSTPTVKGSSRIEAAFDASDRRRFYVPCPECRLEQVLVWSSVQWDDGHPETARYFCEGCGAAWTDAARHGAVRRGRWMAGETFRGIAGFHLNELYSSWVKLGDTATAFLEAKRLPEMLRVWVNTSLGESWEDPGERVDETGLLARREEFPSDANGPLVPEGAALLVAGVDVQDDRIELEVVGYGRDEESWAAEYHVLRGDPSSKALWDDLDEVLTRERRSEAGVPLYVRGACVDTGGHHTQAAYRFCRSRVRRAMPDGSRQFVFPIKGMAGPGRVWPDKASRNNTGRVALYTIRVDAAKDSVYARLGIESPGPGYFHFPLTRGKDYFEGLTAEKVVTRYRKGFPFREYVKVRPRNEPLDCRVYAFAALQGLYAQGLRLDKESEAHALRISNKKPEAAPTAAITERQAPAAAPPVPRASSWLGERRGSWLGR